MNTHATTHPRTHTDHIERYHTEPRKARPYATVFRSMDLEAKTVTSSSGYTGKQGNNNNNISVNFENPLGDSIP